MAITSEQLVKANLAHADIAVKVVDALNEACARFDIVSGHQLAGFLSQCSHESERFTHVEENLNYRADTLRRIWPQHFDETTAATYAHHPERIANRVYAGHMGNGDEASGDGWRFHGRGFIQLTGKDNYAAFDSAVEAKGAILITPSAVALPNWAAMSAAFFWHAHGLNALADAQDVVGMTKRINGGTLGLDERKAMFDEALAIFG